MATGYFGNIRPTDISIEDIEIFYTYSPDRATQSLDVFRLEPSDVLTELNEPSDEGSSILGGLYSLKLASDIFDSVGIYNIIIRPKQIKTTITDCGVLSAIPSVKGIILDTTAPELADISDKLVNNGLVGYRIEYFEEDGTKQRGMFRIVTSANRVEPVNENINNTTQTSIRYRFNDTANLLFLTLTPSTASSVKPNSTPFIGSANQEILLINTQFNPIMMEVELVENTIDTLAIGVFGEQIRSVEDGIVTYYDKNRAIYKQLDLFEIRDDFNELLYEAKLVRETIDETKEFDDIITDDIA
jgi:hypothetical protein